MRLQRIGRKNDPAFRVVVIDSHQGPKSGNHIDLLGSYNPKLNEFTVDKGRAKEWIKKGVQVSDTVHNLLVNEKIIEGKKINVLPKKSPIVTEAAPEDAVKEAETTTEQDVENTEEVTGEAGNAEAPTEEQGVEAESITPEEPAEEVVTTEETEAEPVETKEDSSTEESKEESGGAVAGAKTTSEETK